MKSDPRCHYCDGPVVFVKENQFQIMVWGKNLTLFTTTFICAQCAISVHESPSVRELKELAQKTLEM